MPQSEKDFILQVVEETLEMPCVIRQVDATTWRVGPKANWLRDHMAYYVTTHTGKYVVELWGTWEPIKTIKVSIEDNLNRRKQ